MAAAAVVAAVWSALEELKCFSEEEVYGKLDALTDALQDPAVTGQELNSDGYGQVLIVACLYTLDHHSAFNRAPFRLLALARCIQRKLVTCDPLQQDRVSNLSVLLAVMFWCGPVAQHASLIGCVLSSLSSSRMGRLRSGELDRALVTYLNRCMPHSPRRSMRCWWPERSPANLFSASLYPVEVLSCSAIFSTTAAYLTRAWHSSCTDD